MDRSNSRGAVRVGKLVIALRPTTLCAGGELFFGQTERTDAMNKSIRILGIAGSLRRQSYNRGALRAAQQLVPERATLDVFELDGIPGFSQDDERNPPEKVLELKRRIREADGHPLRHTGVQLFHSRCPEKRD